MDIVQKKKEETEKLIKDALDLKAQVDEIVRLAAQYSEKFEEIGQKTAKVFESAGKLVNSKGTKKLAKTLLKNTKYSTFSKDSKLMNDTADLAGQALVGIGNVVGAGISKVGDWWAKRKENKQLAVLLPKKQELARNKKESILRRLPQIEKDKHRIYDACKSEVSVVIDYNDKQRFDYVYKSTFELFEAHFIFEHCFHLCHFILDEFDAWLKGEHYSETEMKEEYLIYNECVGNLVNWSNLPGKAGYDLPSKLSMGGNLLLGHEKIVDYSFQYDEVDNLGKMVANTKLLSSFIPFGSDRQKFSKYFNDKLKSNTQLGLIIKKKRKTIIWIAVGVIVALLVISLFVR